MIIFQYELDAFILVSNCLYCHVSCEVNASNLQLPEVDVEPEWTAAKHRHCYMNAPSVSTSPNTKVYLMRSRLLQVVEINR